MVLANTYIVALTFVKNEILYIIIYYVYNKIFELKLVFITPPPPKKIKVKSKT